MDSHERLENFMSRYIEDHQRTVGRIPIGEVSEVAVLLERAHREGKRIFIMGNGGGAASASHFATDLGKGASDYLGEPFKILSLTDNTPWLTAIGNDYAYEDIFLRQLRNHAEPGDLLLSVSVSGDSPNGVKALEWANEQGLTTVALVGGKGGRMSEIAGTVVRVPDEHYGRVEDAHMTILHMLAYAFMEGGRAETA